MVLAERVATQRRHERDLTMRDAIFIGVVQCISLVPGISRSAATISAGLFAGLDRVAATRMSFFLSIPALTAAGLFELPSAVSGDIPLASTVIATVVSFVVAYAAVAWLLKFVAHHPITWFVTYRVGHRRHPDRPPRHRHPLTPPTRPHPQLSTDHPQVATDHPQVSLMPRLSRPDVRRVACRCESDLRMVGRDLRMVRRVPADGGSGRTCGWWVENLRMVGRELRMVEGQSQPERLKMR